MEYKEIKSMFKPGENLIGDYGIEQLGNYYVAYKQEKNKTLMLRLQLNKIIINDKSSERVFELALMEDEYDTNLDKIVKEIYTNGKSLHQLPHKLGKTDLGRELSSSESEAKIKAINKYGGKINIKDLIKK
ncbi:hypothetical protein [Staphylococcus hominis]|uniref:hypothetical protein n=1 Tax=Staphylococcus hominis TaxID=1290 RepID=UPI00103A5A84|nr:hypothetical protein [Staphylococcus hominis]MCI2865525.1 hypothetical protein [Staphylococcus hominis]TBW89093.1 hypothetical protein EQ804_03340 [Staphylococcus hominis]